MSLDLEVIANELKRLQRDGIDRVFVEDRTLHQLNSAKERIEPSQSDEESNVDPCAIVTDRDDTRVPTQIKEGTAKLKSVQFPKAPKIQLTRDDDTRAQMASIGEMLNTDEVCLSQLKEAEKIVLGAGSTEADILFCGEAPGVNEASSGEPFTGKAGDLLSKIIATMGLSRKSTYLTYVMKWRPLHNNSYGERAPTVEEIAYCLPYLKAQLDIIQPKVIVALGNAAARALTEDNLEQGFSDLRGTWSSYNDIPLMITFQPSYLLRNNTLKTKRLAWEDMIQVMEKCGLRVSEEQRTYFQSKI
ncbi:MAG: uracil-DNA glycosylase [Verrucomicrobiota bacterium]|nr:uracil-DNA glycosylase [Verrucomicrobiota bacterium]MEC8333543.1 uracil-DNA glycosylase [Verrucomicrobiota bacterium]